MPRRRSWSGCWEGKSKGGYSGIFSHFKARRTGRDPSLFQVDDSAAVVGAERNVGMDNELVPAHAFNFITGFSEAWCAFTCQATFRRDPGVSVSSREMGRDMIDSL
jgi:hypothetical protein